MNLFFHQHVSSVDPDAEIPGFNDLLPTSYRQAQPNSRLKHCVAATAYASLTNQSQFLAVSRKACEAYGTALSSVNKALADPVKALKDETLCAIFILGMFESISAVQLHIFGVPGCGMNRLLYFRGKQQFETCNGELISRAVCAYLHIRNLSLGRRPPPHKEFWFMNVRGCVPYRRAMSSISHICQVMATAEELLTSITLFQTTAACLCLHIVLH